jgi:hypothetical protein
MAPTKRAGEKVDDNVKPNHYQRKPNYHLNLSKNSPNQYTKVELE